MNGIDTLTAKIAAEAQEQSAAELQAAKKAAEAALAEWRKKGTAEAAAITSAADARAEADIARAAAADELERTKKLLAAKHSLIDSAFALAGKKLSALDAEKKQEYMLSYICEASAAGDEEVLLNAADRTEFGEALVAKFNARLSECGKKAALTLACDAVEIDGGFILRHGNIRTDCSISALISMVKNDLIEKVSGVLFA